LYTPLLAYSFFHAAVSSKFIVDTGSPHTILNYSDSLRLNIPHNEKGEIIRIGGRAYQSYIFDNFEIILKSIDGIEVKQKMSVRILKPKRMKLIIWKMMLKRSLQG